MEYEDLSVQKLDSFCRSVKALTEMVEGPSIVTLEFPVARGETREELTITIRGWECDNCDVTHVEAEMQRPARLFDWNQERSDDRLFGEEWSA